MGTESWDVLGSILSEHLDAAVALKRDSNDRPQDHFHPSTIGYCARKTVMERLQVPKPVFETRVQRIFDNGHGVHERITQELRDAGVLILEEAPLSAPDHNLSGHTDGIGNIYVPGKGGIPVIFEMKSAGQKSFDWIAGGGPKKYVPNGADKKHIWQVQLYMYMSGLLYAIIIYECKNDQKRAYFTIKRNMPLITEVLLPKVDLINDHVDRKTLPPRTAEYQPTPARAGKPEKACFECEYCDYRRICESEEQSTAAGGIVDLIQLGNDLLTAA